MAVQTYLDGLNEEQNQLLNVGSITEIAAEQHNSGDITAYIKDNLLNTVAEEGLDCESWQGLVDELIQRASGMFQ
jgi:hypothetical protein